MHSVPKVRVIPLPSEPSFTALHRDVVTGAAKVEAAFSNSNKTGHTKGGGGRESSQSPRQMATLTSSLQRCLKGPLHVTAS